MHDFTTTISGTQLVPHYANSLDSLRFCYESFPYPFISDNQPDFYAMTCLVDKPWGLEDWDFVIEDDYNRSIVMTRSTYERVASIGSSERFVMTCLPCLSRFVQWLITGCFQTYYEYFGSKWTRKNRNINRIIGARHRPTPSSRTRPFVLPQPDTQTFHHGLTLHLLRPSLHTISFVLPAWLWNMQLPLPSYSRIIPPQS